MDNIELKTAFLYPDIFCLNGDRGNISALAMISERLGVKMDVERINTPDLFINFDNYDIFYIPSGELKYIIMTANVLEKQAASIKKAVDNGKIFIITGTSAALFANKIMRADKSEHIALGIGDYNCIEKPKVYGDDLVYDANIFGCDMRITGCQISMTDIILNDDKPLGKVIYGYGNCGREDEGVQINNCIITSALGPVLVKNPQMTTAIIRQALKNKNIDVKLNDIEFEIEINSAMKIWEFIEQKMNK